MALRVRRQARNAAGSRGAGGIGAAVELSAMHLLLVPSTVHPEDVCDLVRARVPASDLSATGQTALGRHSALSGPYKLSMEDAVDAAVPMPWTVVYALSAPIEREDPPIPGTDDRDGFTHAFPHGLPWREEGRTLQLLVALARRVEGAVRIAGSSGLLQPDPQQAVDMIIHSPYWLDPEVLLGVVQRVVPTAQLEIEGADWNGPSDAAYSGAAISPYLSNAPISPYDLSHLHHIADQNDMAVMASDHVIDGFAVAGDIGPYGEDGALEVLVHVGRDREPAVIGQPWADQPFVTYEVRWAPTDWEERERRIPSQSFLTSRQRVQPLVRALTRMIVEATGGVVTDEDGFWLDRYGL
ncbi:MAG: hypothetical protein QG671_1508 [Actinomycetota bacterium]|nr:hypothetical protein [Actinomycetota bacterium]